MGKCYFAEQVFLVTEANSESGNPLIKLALLGAIVFMLLAILVSSRQLLSREANSLNPNDPISLWRDASTETRRLTAERLLDELLADQAFPQPASPISDVQERQARVEKIIGQLDDAINIDISAYVSPNQSMRRTVEEAMQRESMGR